MTAIMADEDSGVEMAQVRAENGKNNKLKFHAKILSFRY